ncbi:hypothetical protein LZD49_33795 [Dyadobacter sp. CY261]|uniref:7TMR-DISM family protein n=1 Tax=Dyadobacter sp. CY261 TaxID=2907203 RepID=UPI001F3E8517|nr:7TM diverse intracellular signaling domain-containing protein [Dyadobacter sp. CY261]MCF0075500.1 hypothetical protein [Dyadobacter sp. CY261]
MIKIISTLLLVLISFWTTGQAVLRLGDSLVISTAGYEVLADRHYILEQILANPSLPFRLDDSLGLGKSNAYWLRISVDNPSSYARHYQVRVEPNLDITLYHFNHDAGKWVAYRTGIFAESNFDRRLHGMLPCTLQGKMLNTLYIKVNVAAAGKFEGSFKRKIIFYQNDYAVEKEKTLTTVWLLTLAILFIFFLNNLYIYFSFKDKTVMYYLIAQLGGMIYITSYRHFFSVLFYCPVFTFWVTPGGKLDFYDANYLLMHIGLLLIMYGFVQFTRSFFDAHKTLPKADRALKYGLTVYLSVTAVIMSIDTGVFYLQHYTVLYENMLALLLVLIILYTCIAGYRRGLRASGSFLIANLLPLVFMVGTTMYHVMVSYTGNDYQFLPDMAIIAQSLGFSIALVARTRLIQNDLKTKEIETRQLEFDLRELMLRQRLIEVENEKINADMRHEKTMNEALQQRLEVNQRELASTTLYIVQKNKMLSGLKGQIEELHEFYPEGKHDHLKNIESILKNDLYLEADWEKFKLHFEQVHPRFFDELYARHPNLTKNEVRLHAYFHMKLSTKEIASLLNIDPASVRRAKTRLYKKMSPSEEV